MKAIIKYELNPNSAYPFRARTIFNDEIYSESSDISYEDAKKKLLEQKELEDSIKSLNTAKTYPQPPESEEVEL